VPTMPVLSQSDLVASMFSTPDMQGVFSARACLQGMLDFESALAHAQAEAGVIPAAAIQSIEACCDSELIDVDALCAAAGPAGNLAIPLVRQLTALVTERDAEAGKFVHWGATSQDAIDTGMLLQLRQALGLIGRDLNGLIAALATLCERHRDTPQAGRTWLMQALPVTFGLKVAGWIDGLLRRQVRLDQVSRTAMVLQFGGAAGTLASLGDAGLAVTEALARRLQLGVADMPWHTQRDRLCEVACELGILVGSLGKVARDISLAMQTEVGELAEPVAKGRGGSSAMPHKRNPVGCAIALTCAARTPALVSTMLAGMVQEHERALGGWQAEWESLPQIAQLAAASTRQLRLVAEGLTVDVVRMQSNLLATNGLIMAEAATLALGPHIGRLPAHKLVEQACEIAVSQRRDLRSVLSDSLAADPQLTSLLPTEELDRLFDPANYLGEAGRFVDRVLQTHRRQKSQRKD
jgi:3-carboxy-cis,cis-muconate cycloisomerase